MAIHQSVKTGEISHFKPGINGPPEKSVRDFQNFVGPGPVTGFEIFLASGPVRSQITKFFLVLVRSRYLIFSRFWPGSVLDFETFLGPGPVRDFIFCPKIFSVLVRAGPTFLKFFRSRPTGFGPWIPVSNDILYLINYFSPWIG